MNGEQIISFETAKLAKEVGFCISFYDKEGHIKTSLVTPDVTYAPTQNILRDWIDKNHKIFVGVNKSYGDRGKYYSNFTYFLPDYQSKTEAFYRETFELAFEVALQKALEIILKRNQKWDT